MLFRSSDVMQEMIDARLDNSGINSGTGTHPPLSTQDDFEIISLPSISTASWSRVESVGESSTWSDVGSIRMR